MKPNPEYKTAPAECLIMDMNGSRIERAPFFPRDLARFKFAGFTGRRDKRGRFQRDQVIVKQTTPYDPSAEYGVAVVMMNDEQRLAVIKARSSPRH